MKYLAKFMRPVYKVLCKKKIGPILNLLIIFAPIFIGLLIGLVKAQDQADRWQEGIGVITNVGTEPKYPDSPDYRYIVESQVDISSNGEPDIHTTETEWYAQEGDSVDFWTKDNVVSFDDQGSSLRMIILWGLLWGIMVGIVSIAGLIFIERTIVVYDKRVAEEAERIARQLQHEADLKRAAPRSLQEFVDLCREHSETSIGWAEAHSFGACDGGIVRFERSYFPGRTELTIEELLPFIEGDNAFWADVVNVVGAKLKSIQVVRSTYDFRLENIYRPQEGMKELSSK